MSSPYPVKRWSFSTLKKFEKCPYSVYLAKVERAPVPPRDETHPAERGNIIHLEAENFVKGEGPFTKALRKFDEPFHQLQEAYAEGRVELEQEWGFTEQWDSVSWRDTDCWAMIKCDVVEHLDEQTLHTIDHKTGKSMGNEVPHTQQLQLYALAAFMKYPQVQVIKASLWYIDEGKPRSKTYNRTQVPAFLPRWTERAYKLTQAMTFPPKPNRGNCKFCDFGLDNGTGACAYAVSTEAS